VDIRVKDRKGKTRKRTVSCDRASFVASGPAFPPKGLQGDKDVTYGKTAAGYGYIHYRRCKGSIPYRTDDALKALGRVPGLILDFRANAGGGFSHEDLFGRFVPSGKTLRFNETHQSRGEANYAGPIVVIVDGLTRGAGETGSGMFKEDGRAYMLGESATAGMSSSKKTLDLPSGKFQLHVSVASNMGRFNGGKGLEGIGVIPHEIVEFDPDDLVREEDTLIKRAEAIFRAWPKDVVPYDPAKHGWKAP
jgi:C-terminal processing protease CtpA/Prc